jgi:hypothetical protein
MRIQLLAVAALVSLAAAGRCQSAPTQAAPAQDASPPTAPAQAALPVDRSKLHVTGLTNLNAGPVEIELQDIAHRSWHCVGCDVTQAQETPCPVCKGPMIPIEESLLSDVEVDVAAGTLRFDVLPGKDVKLSEIQAAIKRFRVVIPPEQQFIPRECRLLVAGPTTQEAADKLVAGLQERKLFQKLTGRFDWKSEQVELTVKCAEQASRPQLEEALAQAGVGYRLADIVWFAGPGAVPGRG